VPHAGSLKLKIGCPPTRRTVTTPYISHFEAQILARSRDIPSDMAQHQFLVCEIDILSRFDQADVEIRSTLDILDILALR
jgi:hypothetical protein